MFCENIYVKFSQNINLLSTDKCSISVLHLTKWLKAIILTPFLNVYSSIGKYTLALKVFCELAQIGNILKILIQNLTQCPAWHCRMVR